MAVVRGGGINYYINDDLKKVWDRIKQGKLIKSDEDRVYIVDGRERTGKSVFTFQQAAYLDPTFSKNIKQRICFTPESFLQAIRTAPQGSVVVFDEAFRGLSSRASLSKINKILIQAMMEMGQRNLIVFIVLPSFFLLDIYPAMLRSNCLFHIYKHKTKNNRYFRIYNFQKKAQLYQIGLKKGWSYAKPFSKFRGSFFNKYPIDEQTYRKMKYDALKENDLSKPDEKNKYQVQRDKLIIALKRRLKLKLGDIVKLCEMEGIDLRKTAIGEITKGVLINPVKPETSYILQ